MEVMSLFPRYLLKGRLAAPLLASLIQMAAEVVADPQASPDASAKLAGQLFQHMIKKANARLDVIVPPAIKGDGGGNPGFRSVPFNGGRAHVTYFQLTNARALSRCKRKWPRPAFLCPWDLLHNLR